MTSQINIEKELNSEDYKKEWKRLILMRNSIIGCLSFCYMNSCRDGISGERNFFLRMIDDITQSVISIEIVAEQGIINTCRRELRYLIELSIKSFFIVKNSGLDTFEKQLVEYEKLLNSSNINPVNTLSFHYLKPEIQEEFKTEVKKIYGYLCKYSHSSSHQITERLERAKNGRTIGYEGIEELRELNNDIEKVLAIVAIFIFHSVAQYVVGDFLVEENGETIDWYFNRSKYINLIDENFDYKHERQLILEKLKNDRINRVKF